MKVIDFCAELLRTVAENGDRNIDVVFREFDAESGTYDVIGRDCDFDIGHGELVVDILSEGWR